MVRWEFSFDRERDRSFCIGCLMFDSAVPSLIHIGVHKDGSQSRSIFPTPTAFEESRNASSTRLAVAPPKEKSLRSPVVVVISYPLPYPQPT
jgi:hypothetical protein